MEQARRKEQELDLGLTYINNSNLARKTQIRRFPDQEQLRAAAGQGGSPARDRQRNESGMRQNQNASVRENVRRNPYLVDYKAQGMGGAGPDRSGRKKDIDDINMIWGEERRLTGIDEEQVWQSGTISHRGAAQRTPQGMAPGQEGRRMVRQDSGRQLISAEEARRQPSAGRTRQHSSEEETRRQPSANGTRQRPSVEETRRQPSANGTRQRPSVEEARRQPLPAGARQGRYRGAVSGAVVSEPVRRPGASGGRAVPAGRDQRRQLQQERRRREALRRRLIMGIAEGVVLICLVVLLFVVFHKPKEQDQNTPVMNQQEETQPQNNLPDQKVQGFSKEVFDTHPAWTEDFLTVSEYSRPGEPLGEVKNIFVHYTANPGTSAKQNRSYFEQLKDTHERGASAHFIIGYEGEIIQCVPMDEVAYAVMTRNEDSISIECCYKSKDGSFTQETYDSLISLLAWLTDVYGLDSEDILRHYDCGGKKCPIYYTEHEDAWERLKADVRDYTL